MSMNTVMTLRLPEKDVKAIEEIASKEKIDKSTAVRELVEMGKTYFAIQKYKEGKISVEKAAELAGINISEMIDTFTELGITSNIDINDYLAGKDFAKQIFK